MSAFTSSIRNILNLSQRLDCIDESIQTRGPAYYNCSEIDPQDFIERIWPIGRPVVLRGMKLQGDWGPEYWIERETHKVVTVEDCRTGETRKTTVPEYLKSFGAGSPRSTVEKLKVRERGSVFPF